VVLSRDSAIPRLRRALVGPCTTTIRGIPSEVLLEPGEDPVPQASVVNLDFVESVSVAALVHRLGPNRPLREPLGGVHRLKARPRAVTL
jgi:mRNA interferase MazF